MSWTRALRLIATLSAVVSLILLPTPARAVTSAASATPSNPAPGATGTSVNFSWSNYQTATAVKCISAQFTGGFAPASTLYSFDSSTQGWTEASSGSFVTTQDTTTHRTGAGALLATRTWPAGTQYDALTDNMTSLRDLSAGGNSFSAWIKVPAGAPGNWWVGQIGLLDSSFAANWGPSVTLPVGYWTQVTFTPPSALLQNARSLEISITANGVSSSVGVDVDDIQQGTYPGGVTSGRPAGMSVYSATMTGTYAPGSWALDAAANSAGTAVFNNASGTAPTGTTASLIFGNITQPSAASGQDVYVTVTAYSATGSGSSGACGGTVLDGPTVAVYATTPANVASVTVDPSLSFSVGAHSGACNGVTQTGAASSASVTLGHATIATVNTAAQDLTVADNAGGGALVYMRSNSGSANQIMSDGFGHYIADTTGTTSSPAALTAGTAAFGYTVTGGGVSLASSTWAKVPTSTGNDTVVNATIGTSTACVAYGVTVSGATVAAAYTATIVYTAVPTY